MSIKGIFTALICSLLLIVNCCMLNASAEVMLPDGAVKGLPERLTAMDSDGKPVNSETGEYFFHVEGMEYGVTYSKNVQLMNLRDDKSYHIYFYVEPLFKNGEIDLEEGCECIFQLDGSEVFRGNVNGKGTIDLTENVLDCGLFNPGDSHVLNCSVTWNDLDVLVGVNNGHRLIDIDGEHVLIGADDNGYVEGEIEFKWIFYAAVDEDSGTPNTGLLAVDNKILLIFCGVLGVLIIGMFILILLAKRKKKEE